MTKVHQPVKVEEIGSFNMEQPLTMEVEGWIVGGSEIFLVDNCRNPMIRIHLPTSMEDILMDNIPERLRVGGEYMWEEKAVISGAVLKSSNGLEFRSVEKIVMPEIQREILITKYDAL